MEAIGAIGILFVAFLLLVLTVLAILVPWFVYRGAHYQRLTYELLRDRQVSSAEVERILEP